MALKKFTDDNVMRIADEETIEEMVLPSAPRQWHMGLARLETKSNSPVKGIVNALENFEDCERKFDINPKNDQRKNHKDNDRDDD